MIDKADDRAVRMVYAMLEADESNENATSDLPEEQEAILNEHIALYKKGLMEFSSWDEVRARITSKK